MMTRKELDVIRDSMVNLLSDGIYLETQVPHIIHDLKKVVRLLMEQAKQTAYYNGQKGDSPSVNKHKGFTYMWEEYLVPEAWEFLRKFRGM